MEIENSNKSEGGSGEIVKPVPDEAKGRRPPFDAVPPDRSKESKRQAKIRILHGPGPAQEGNPLVSCIVFRPVPPTCSHWMVGDGNKFGDEIKYFASKIPHWVWYRSAAKSYYWGRGLVVHEWLSENEPTSDVLALATDQNWIEAANRYDYYNADWLLSNELARDITLNRISKQPMLIILHWWAKHPKYNDKLYAKLSQSQVVELFSTRL
jgi:hypothetical protein